MQSILNPACGFLICRCLTVLCADCKSGAHLGSVLFLGLSWLWSLLCGAERSGSWTDPSLPAWRWAPGCWWCPTTADCCSAGDTGTAASASPSWEKASWWEESAGTLVRTGEQTNASSLGSRTADFCSAVFPTDVVTCLALDLCGIYLVSGSRDTSCIVWKVLQQVTIVWALARSICSPTVQSIFCFIHRQGGFSSGLSPRPVQVLCGHDQEVTCVAISTELDMAVSGSKVKSVSFQTVKYTVSVCIQFAASGFLYFRNSRILFVVLFNLFN